MHDEGVIRDSIDKILSSREFAARESRPGFLEKTANMIKSFVKWLKDILDGVKIPDAGSGGYGKELSPENALILKVAGAVLITAIIAAAAFFILRNLHSSRRIREKEDAKLLSTLKEPKIMKERALECFKKGDYRQAVRFLYISFLLDLNMLNIIRIDKSKTNRQYLREIRESDYSGYELIEEFTNDFNVYWYGNKNPDRSKFEYWYEKYSLLVREVEA